MNPFGGGAQEKTAARSVKQLFWKQRKLHEISLQISMGDHNSSMGSKCWGNNCNKKDSRVFRWHSRSRDEETLLPWASWSGSARTTTMTEQCVLLHELTARDSVSFPSLNRVLPYCRQSNGQEMRGKEASGELS